MEKFKCQFVIICDTTLVAIINHPTPNLLGPGRPSTFPWSWGTPHQYLGEKQQLQHEMFLSVVPVLLVSSPRSKHIFGGEAGGRLRLPNLSFISFNFRTHQVFLILIGFAAAFPTQGQFYRTSGYFFLLLSTIFVSLIFHC